MKIFPYLGDDNPLSSFKILFISEGYLPTERTRFIADCIEFSDKLLTVSPFNLTRINPHWISIYSSFTPSNQRGPAIGEPAPNNRTAFDSSYDISSKTLTFNQAKVKSYIEAEKIQTAIGLENFTDYCKKGSPSYGGNGALIVLLMPAFEGQPEGVECEYEPGASEYYFVAVSKDGLWHQVIIRALCKTLGLGDEYELDGDENLAPTTGNSDLIFCFNLEHFPNNAPSLTSDSSKWAKLFSFREQMQSIPVHLKTGPAESADNSIDEIPVLHTKPEYWEGGGGFRTKVFRSAKDCLQRRKIGSTTLPLRLNEVPFCPACTYFIKSLF